MIPIMKGCGAGRLGSAAHLPLPVDCRGWQDRWASCGRREPPLSNPGEGSPLLSTLEGITSLLGGAKRGVWLVFFSEEDQTSPSLRPHFTHSPAAATAAAPFVSAAAARPAEHGAAASRSPGGSPARPPVPAQATPAAPGRGAAAGPAAVTAHGRAGVPGLLPPPRPEAPSAGPRRRAVSLATTGDGGASMVGSGAERGGSGSARPGVTCGRRPRCCETGMGSAGPGGAGVVAGGAAAAARGAAVAGASLRGSAGCRLSRAGCWSGVRQRAPAAEGMERAAEGSPYGVTAPQPRGTASQTASFFGILPASQLHTLCFGCSF